MMRTFLHKLMVDITRHPREVITPVWSSSIVVNAFRIYEYWFGRRAGIRIEGRSTSDGKQYSYTWENLFAVYEGLIRAAINRTLPKFSIVYVPQLQLVGMTQDGVSPFRFAIAFDNAAKVANGSSVSSLSGAYTVTGSNPIIFASCWGAVGSPSVTGITYNSVSMTKVADENIPADRGYSVFILPSPATGSNTLIASGSSLFILDGASYSGAKQTSQPDAFNTGSWSSANSFTSTVTTIANNCWMIVMFKTSSGNAPSNGTGTTVRLNDGNGGIADSGGGVSPGSNSLVVNFTVADQGGYVITSFAPVVAAVNSGFFRLVQ